VEELKAEGNFHNGVFSWKDARGKKHCKDGYEAAWEQSRAHKITYPAPPFEQPVLWRADRFSWQVSTQAGVHIRRFVEFTGKRLSVVQVRIDGGASCVFGAGERETLLYCVRGEARIDEEALGPISAIRLLRHEAITIEATQTTEFYVLGFMHETACSSLGVDRSLATPV